MNNEFNIDNMTVNCDSYKLCHWPMYTEDTTHVYSYFEARNGARFNKTVFFGLQYLLEKYLTTPISLQDIVEGLEFTANHLGDEKYYNVAMWEYIYNELGGYLPIKIRAVPEGTPVDASNVLMTVENTDPKCPALTNHLETILTHVWGPSTVATLSREVRILCKYYLEETAEPDALDTHLPFMLHDFGFRGVNQLEAAGIAGAAHLINFRGTDTIPAMQYARKYYNANLANLAWSVPASEHSVMTAHGAKGEERIFKRMLDTFPTGILSVVIDSYNYKRFISEYAGKYKDQILARGDGKVVFRPDSGEPTTVTLDVLKELALIFGTTVNSKGYNQLNPKVGVIWGDGIEYSGIRDILYAMKNNNWSASNIVFGMGGGLLQKINRDTQRFAFKSSAQKRNGQWYNIFKEPLDTSKTSKRGRLILTQNEKGHYQTEQTFKEEDEGLLRTVFLNGEVINPITFGEIRKNAE